MDEVPEALRVERAAGAEDEAADPVFLGLGRVLVIQLAEPACGGLGFFHVEAAGVEDGSKIYAAALGFDDFRAGIQVVENGAEFLELLFVDEIGFVNEEDIGELHLIDKKVGDGAFVLFAEGGVFLLQ